jgi:hypothetical protein
MKLALALLACLALAAPAASARPVEEFLEPSSSCETTWAAAYETGAPSGCEEQVLASRGTGAPAQPAAAAGGSAVARSTAAGFDWGSAAIGAAGGAGAIALLSVGVMPMLSRRRVRPAR